MQATPNTVTTANAGLRANTLAAFEVMPTGKAVGAEIRGFNATLPIPDDVKQALRDAWAGHMVLYWHGPKLNDDQLDRKSTV